jgi:glucosyl-3-phosphoglycerate synthase
MSDFYQTGAVTTLHKLGKRDIKDLEAELLEFSKQCPIALILPCHARELGTKALKLIVKELKNVPYLSEIIVGLDGASQSEWRRARNFFKQLPQSPIIIWTNGARVQKLLNKLEDSGLSIGSQGKGRNVWLCFGYVLASEKSKMVAIHDCDILTYSRELLSRLCYPVAHPSLGFDFCKGYYARFTNKLNGRVMRLLVTPLLRSLKIIIGHHPFLTYLDNFRYLLSGEISMDTDLIRRVRIPPDWGLEIGMLAEIFKNSSIKSICQADLCDNFDHKHQEISVRDPDKGLNKMAIDISKSLFRTMAAEGIILDTGVFDTLLSSYQRQAEDAVRHYAADAAINGLAFDRHEEESMVSVFANSIRIAAKAFLADPLGATFISNWNRVQSALPEILRELLVTIQQDNQS